MAVSDGIFDKVGNDSVQSGSLLSLLPSLLIHGAVVLAIWLGLFEAEQVQPPVTFISLAPAAAPAPEQAPPAPMVPAPDVEPEFEPLPLPATGMVLPQPEPPAEPMEPILDFTPPEPPKPESFPFDPKATRVAEPEPEPDAVAIEKAKEPEKPKEPEKVKEPEKPKETKKKPEKPKKKETKKPTAPAVAEKKPAKTPPPAAATASASATPAKASPSAPSKPAPAAQQNAAISDAPVRVTNPNYAGACPISYPERARRRNQEGTVVVHALIGPDGKPIEVTVSQSSGHRLLDEAAQEAISNCAFVPQKVGGRAVRAIVEIPIPFKLI
jgi:protein TonB